LLFAFCFTNLQIFAQGDPPACPDGWNSGIMTYNYPINDNDNCDIDIYYCWKNDANNQRQVVIRGAALFVHCADIIITPEFWENMLKAVLINEAKLPPNDPEYLEVPLCSEGGAIMVWAHKPSCYYYSVSTINEGQMYLNPCTKDNEYLCSLKYKLCWDNSQNPMVLTFTKLQQQTTGSCPNAIPPLTTVPSDALIPGYASDCYYNCSNDY
jgi:hypothetical protein